ncbi:MBL fold metallo-hydrolase [Pseudomonas syringae]|uniref:MBL fold metallo-hydrolase n=1 Tax=Pseudomonas syringae group TaxID=136849 RepID=UPI00040248D4|nr:MULTISPECIES: MBL fold metallo-hydrolase [Pseudomonas syringae group]MCR8718080.1 MBL fold metallo-hydrolase [Pseudomonas syringae]
MLRNSLLALSLAALPLAALLPLAAQAADPLAIEVYNPAEKAIFPVSSELVTGKHDAVLIDAQFQRNDAQALVAKIKASGKKLTTVYISHSDPDYYFGLDVIQAAFPDAKIVASAPTVKAIKASMQGKLAYWSPILKDNAPEKLVLPDVLEGDHLTLEGQPLEIKGLTGPAPQRSYVWIPSLKTVVGGVVVSSGIHVWVADTQSPKSRQDWLATLKGIEALKPATVIPGHYLGQIPQGTQAVAFTADYLKSFEQQAAKAKDAKALIDAMQKAWPQLAEPSSLELSAKVIKGEMKWPN